jgi:hypothetical protein
MQVDNVAVQQPEIVARLSEKALAWHAQLPSGPVDATAGKNDYPWPGSAPAADAPANQAAKKKGRKAK